MKCPCCGEPLEKHERGRRIYSLKVYLCEKAKIPVMISTTGETYRIRRK